MSGTVQLNQQYIEVLASFAGEIDLAQQYVEVLATFVPPTVKLGQQYVEVLAAPQGSVQLGQQYVEVLATLAPSVKLGQQYVEVLFNSDAPAIRVQIVGNSLQVVNMPAGSYPITLRVTDHDGSTFDKSFTIVAS